MNQHSTLNLYVPHSVLDNILCPHYERKRFANYYETNFRAAATDEVATVTFFASVQAATEPVL